MANSELSLGPFGESNYGFFRATVINNNDPAGQGRVKLFTPTIAAQMKQHFDLKEGEYIFNFPGDIINGEQATQANKTLSTNTNALSSKLSSALANDSTQPSTFSQKHIEAMAGVLDWVPQASPLIGSGTIGQYDAARNLGHTSDTPPPSIDKHSVSPRANVGTPEQKTGGVINPNAPVNRPPGYINAAKGMFSVPRVGAKVWVFFENGNITRPVYFAYSFGETEFKTIFHESADTQSYHQPQSNENVRGSDSLYGGKIVLNEKGGGVEIVNTDSFESVRIYDHSGNHITMNRLGIVIESQSDTTFVTRGNLHHTVYGNYALDVQGEMHRNVKDHGHEINGDLDTVAKQKEWLKKAEPHFKNNALFAEVPKHTTTVKKDFAKKTPNNTFCLPINLKFSLPPGLDPKVLLQQINKVLEKISKVLNLPLLLLKGAEEMASNVLGLLSNPFNFLLSMLGDRLKLMGLRLCNKKSTQTGSNATSTTTK